MSFWNSVVLLPSDFTSFRFSVFFSPCAPVGRPPQSLKKSHDIWIASYHTGMQEIKTSIASGECSAGQGTLHFRVITLLFCTASLSTVGGRKREEEEEGGRERGVVGSCKLCA